MITIFLFFTVVLLVNTLVFVGLVKGVEDSVFLTPPVLTISVMFVLSVSVIGLALRVISKQNTVKLKTLRDNATSVVAQNDLVDVVADQPDEVALIGDVLSGMVMRIEKIQQKLKVSQKVLRQVYTRAKIGSFACNIHENKCVLTAESAYLFDVDLNTDFTFDYLLEIALPGDRHALEHEIRFLQEPEQVVQFDFRVLVQGEVKYLSASAELCVDAPSVLVMVQDVTESLVAQQAKDDALLAANNANTLVSRFLANMSHEIRTPLNGVIGLTGLVLSTELTAEKKGYLESSEASAKALLKILNDILDYSKIDAGRMSMDEISFSVDRVLQNLQALFLAPSQQSGVALSVSVADDGPDLVVGDPGRLGQVLSNLLGNALKFTEQGSVHVMTKVLQISQSDVEIEFAVQDTGVGIALEKQSSIFDAFNQADLSVTRKYSGTGLGLAISRRLVELMGGHMWLESEEGVGSTFYFSVSFLRQAKKEAPVPLQVLAEADMRARVAGKHILVVEDKATNRMIMTELLKQLEVTTEVAENGQEALEMVIGLGGDRHYDAILMDNYMPVLSGIDATCCIRSLDLAFQPAIIAVTGGVMEKERQACFDAGMNDFVNKPIELNELLVVLSKWLA